MLPWILVSILILGCIAWFAHTPSDADPYFIQHQASISTTREADESAVLRSLVNDHGRSLLGAMHPLNKFTFQNLWEEGASFKISYVTRTGHIRSITNLPSLVANVQDAIAGYPPRSEITLSFDVGIEALIAFLAVVLSGKIPKIEGYSSQRGDKSEKAEASETEKPAILRHAEFKFAQGLSGISIRKDPDTEVVVPLFDTEDELKKPLENAVDDPTFEALRVGDNVSISQVDLGVAIAAQLTALGTQHRWSQNDSVFVAPGPLTAYSIVVMFTALSAKSQLIFAELGPMVTATSVLQRAKPTILVSDDLSMRSLAKKIDDFRIVSWIQYGMRALRLKKGALTKPGMIPGFFSVRAILTATGPDPYQWLDNSEMSTLRTLTGTQVIHVYNPDDNLPVTQTVVGDYRSGSKLPGVVMGPPLPGLELKRKGAQNLMILRANHSSWQKISLESSEGARLGKDGCLYIPEKRHDFSDYYYYTGELQ